MRLTYRGEIQGLGDDVRAVSLGSFVQLYKGMIHYKLSGPLDGKVVRVRRGFGIILFDLS